jgi:DNA-binding NarL/FixJ family response regulator
MQGGIPIAQSTCVSHDAASLPMSESRITAFSGEHKLTTRQREILSRLLLGESPKEIAYHLGVTHTTIRFHAVQLYRRCGVNNQREILALLARYCGAFQQVARPDFGSRAQVAPHTAQADSTSAPSRQETTTSAKHSPSSEYPAHTSAR